MQGRAGEGLAKHGHPPPLSPTFSGQGLSTIYRDPRIKDHGKRTFFYSFIDKEGHETTGLKLFQSWRFSSLIPFLIGQEMSFWQKFPLCPDYSYTALAVVGSSVGAYGLQKHTRSTISLSLKVCFLRRVLLSLFPCLCGTVCWQPPALIIPMDTLKKIEFGPACLISRVSIHTCRFLNSDSFTLFRKGKNPEKKGKHKYFLSSEQQHHDCWAL